MVTPASQVDNAIRRLAYCDEALRGAAGVREAEKAEGVNEWQCGTN